jgi:hypothetical protein
MPAPFRTRLSVLWLESRENPSGPTPIDPVGDPTPPPPTGTTTTTVDPATQAAIDAAAAAIAAMTTTTTTTTTNTIYNTPTVP